MSSTELISTLMTLFFLLLLGIEIDENGHTDRLESRGKNEKKHLKKLDLKLLELIQTKKILILMTKLVKFKILLINLVLNYVNNQQQTKLLKALKI